MLEKIKYFDKKIISSVSKLHRKNLNKFMIIVTLLGNNGLVWFAISVPLIINRETRLLALKFISAVLLSGFLGEIVIKRIVGRIRPSKTILQEHMLIKKPRSYSFPSGHTSSSFAGACMLAFYCGLFVGILAFVLAILIGFSRIYLRVHYPSDVFAGAILGIICFELVNFFIAG